MYWINIAISNRNERFMVLNKYEIKLPHVYTRSVDIFYHRMILHGCGLTYDNIYWHHVADEHLIWHIICDQKMLNWVLLKTGAILNKTIYEN